MWAHPTATDGDCGFIFKLHSSCEAHGLRGGVGGRGGGAGVRRVAVVGRALRPATPAPPHGEGEGWGTQEPNLFLGLPFRRF